MQARLFCSVAGRRVWPKHGVRFISGEAEHWLKKSHYCAANFSFSPLHHLSNVFLPSHQAAPFIHAVNCPDMNQASFEVAPVVFSVCIPTVKPGGSRGEGPGEGQGGLVERPTLILDGAAEKSQ